MGSLRLMLIALCIVVVLPGMWACAQSAKEGLGGVPLELTHSVIVVSTDVPLHAKYAELLQSEIAKRTGITLPVQLDLPVDGAAAIVFETIEHSKAKLPEGLAVPQEAEGYALWVDQAARRAPTVHLVGRDDRGVLFAVGRLLRLLHMKKGELILDSSVRIATAPRYPVRGHELGYRNKSNTYDAWSVEQFEQYVCDMAVFGANGVQLVVQLDNAAKDGPHMTEPVMERAIKLSKLMDEYGLQVWIWLAPSEKTITPESAPAVLEKCRALFEQCARIDAVFVPGGDPGDTPPEILLPLLKDMAGVLRASHPKAGMWLSNEDMSHEWNATLFDSLNREQPEWLTGVVFGTWVKLSLEEMRGKIPAQYPIVQYADITHSIECQYPVNEWDLAFATTLGRETINPRPAAMAHIFKAIAPFTIGFNTYSDGVNDDVNKILWTALGWDPDAPVEEILREYGRYFVGEDLGDEVAKGLLALEQNWQGPLPKNAGVGETLALWQAIEKQAGPAVETNWRLQMALLRAYYDAYIQQRLEAETKQEKAACAELARASTAGVEPAIAKARNILAEATAKPVALELRARIEDLAGMLFKSIGMQLSVEKYGASNWERGAILDAVDRPLNNRGWLETRFAAILAEKNDKTRLAMLNEVLSWGDPGPGGFYDDLGNAANEPHLVRQKSWADDPGFVASAQDECIEVEGRDTWRLSWLNQGQTLFGTPLKVRYEGLDPKAAYSLQVVYTGRFRPTMQLTANGGKYTIHGPLPQPEQPERQTFAIPREATQDGVLELEWMNTTGRGCQVAEVWLKREP
ncbi:MAG: hypothetical protein IT364_22900 [Candidatus Hydrogenedentes bacterium]|nr:hypothetical protein [Candidatus Hydrogenedentota bacterium]